MGTVAKLKTGAWFLARPSFWAQAVELGLRKLRPDHDGPALRAAARDWAAARAVSASDALAVVGLSQAKSLSIPRLSEELVDEARRQALRSAVKMGGAGDIDLLYAATVLSNAERVVETGVAYGWSSLAVLSALHERKVARLISVDMPYPKMHNEDFVGIVVPEKLRGPWTLIREPDRNGLRKAISQLGGTIDLCHYDSDKSWWGRKFAYPQLWKALGPGGVFISDDVQDNLAFRDFVEEEGKAFAIVECSGKYVGIARKQS